MVLQFRLTASRSEGFIAVGCVRVEGGGGGYRV